MQLAVHLHRLPCFCARRSGLLCVHMLLSQVPQRQRCSSVRPQPILYGTHGYTVSVVYPYPPTKTRLPGANDTHSAGAPLRFHCSQMEPLWTSNSLTVPSAAPRAISFPLADTVIARAATPANHFATDVLVHVSTNCTFPSVSAAHVPPLVASPSAAWMEGYGYFTGMGMSMSFDTRGYSRAIHYS
jgi:hypothetical protein